MITTAQDCMKGDLNHKLFVKPRLLRDGTVYDGSNMPVKPYPHSETVLRRIKEEPDVKLGVASM